MRFYLTGHHTFGNRGCEAIVRSTVVLLNKHFKNVEILVPSNNIELDRKQWPYANKLGVQFVNAYLPAFTRYWIHFLRLPFGFLKKASWPLPFPQSLINEIKSVDAVIAVGGDNYSLDYRLPSMLMAIDKLAMKLDKPVILWSASVGPFESEPFFVPVIQKHLSKMKQIFVRESISYHYLTETLHLKNVSQMADSAFTLEKEFIQLDDILSRLHGARGLIGMNISPLIERYKNKKQNLKAETVNFIHAAVSKGFSILLVPHVTDLEGSNKNNDSIYMSSIMDQLELIRDHVALMPSNLNAAQTKFIISQVQFFIGARTHATIAALSSGVPTLSIAYSVKAKGINQDLLGNMPVVLPTPEFSADRLMAGLDYLINNEFAIKECLSNQLPSWTQKVDNAMSKVKVLLTKNV